MHYNPSVLEAFNSVEHIMRDVDNGWLIRYLYSNAVSSFFLLIHIYICKKLCYNYSKITNLLIFHVISITFLIGFISIWLKLISVFVVIMLGLMTITLLFHPKTIIKYFSVISLYSYGRKDSISIWCIQTNYILIQQYYYLYLYYL